MIGTTLLILHIPGMMAPIHLNIDNLISRFNQGQIKIGCLIIPMIIQIITGMYVEIPLAWLLA
ncbi:hypothetical protein C1H69_23055 [Billgrantia endophytica]|uniref:Uncharacterized protein n=1 Tax=Billgrantia endophytica TaxID=2033802 RepID=A0A2N7TUG5_9GAMM|nr:hypothetical protein C1H69_23055 [Halomonas endophytica]